MNAPERPRRPFGLSLMMVLCFVSYVAVPMLYVFYPMALAESLRPEGGAAGADLPSTGWLQIGFSLAFTVALVLAWRGRAHQMRWVVAGLALLYAAAVVINGIQILNTPLASVWNSAEQFIRDSQPTVMTAAVLMALFVSWYFNRAPAVAFFTGKPVVYIEDVQNKDGAGDVG